MPFSPEDASPTLWGEARTPAAKQRRETQVSPDAREIPRSARARVAITRIDADPHNPRAPTDADVQALAASIAQDGLLHPIVVRPTGDRYTIVAGHRRFAAWCRCAAAEPSDQRWRAVEVVVREIGPEEALTLMLVENLQRKALSPLEEAITLQRVRITRGWTNRRIAEEIHKSEMYVSRRLRVLEDTALCDAILTGQLAVTTAEELLRADDRDALVQQAIAENWSPADARRAIAADRSRASVSSGRDQEWRGHIAALEHLLENQTALPGDLPRELVEAVRRLASLCPA
jgi:ParB family transcriptional regulator, chromosome partitioning protein